MERGESDKVVLVVLVDVENGVTNLLDVDGSTERGLLSVVTLETDTVLLVPDAVCGDWGVMARLVVRRDGVWVLELYTPDLLTDELSGTGLVNPLAQEQLTQERVEGLLLATELLVTRGVLLLEGAQEPLQDEHAALLLVGFGSGSDQD